MAKSTVSIVKGNDPQEMVDEALALLGGVEAFVKPGDTVVVKPNAGHYYPPESSVCTSPAVVTAVIRALRRASPKEIIVAESAAVGADTQQCLDLTGIRAAAETEGVERVIDIKREKDLVLVPVPDARSDIKAFKLPRFLLEADVVVNVPIFKAHASTVFTCALKNIKGVVQDVVHYQMHQTDLAAAMMDVWSVMRNVRLSIADMIRPQEGYGPHCGAPVDFGCIVASADPVALDATACRMVGLGIDKVDYFRAALDRRLGNIQESDIEVRGSSVADVYNPLWMPHTEGFGAWPEYNVHNKGCSSCQSLASYTLARLQALGQYESHVGFDILLGRHKELPAGVEPGEKLLLFGTCLRPLKRRLEEMGLPFLFVDGCPPGESLPYRTIVAGQTRDPNQQISPEDRAMSDSENDTVIRWVKERAALRRRKLAP